MSSYYIEDCFDEADVYNMDQHKFIHAGHSGKGRSKREVQQRTNAYDPNGHTRKTMQKLVNNKQSNNNNNAEDSHQEMFGQIFPKMTR